MTLTLPEAVARLEAGLRAPLPGRAAQALMSPSPRPTFPANGPPRSAGALVLLFPRGSEAHVLLTVRKSDLTRHAGQVSLPGGIPHAGESLEEAALRETEEEVGVPVDSVRVLGALTPLHIPVSGFDLHSFAGVLASAGSFTPHALEVERILEAPLGELVSGEAIGVETRMIADREVRVPFYRIEGEKVWGATAMVLSEVLVLLGSTSRPRA